MFQSSLEGNPEWNLRLLALRAGGGGFQSSLEGNPEWNAKTWCRSSTRAWFQSSLEGNPEWNMIFEAAERPDQVSILTRGKPRVELRCGFSRKFVLRFQSSLEGNPEWNLGVVFLVSLC